MAEPQTLQELLDKGGASDPAIIVPDGPTLTYKELRGQVHKLMDELRSFGVKRGDRVAIVLPNGLENVVSFLAVSGVTTAAPLNAAFKPDEFEFYMDDTNAKAVITGPDASEDILNSAPEGAIHITVTANDDGEVSFEGPRAVGTDEPDADKDDVALVLHTSGTTSRPKRVPLTHANLTTSIKNVAETYALTPGDRSMCIMPLFHVHGLVASTLATLYSGGAVIVPSRFNPLNFWPVMKEHGATWYSAVPSMHQALLNRAKSRKNGEPSPSEGSALRFIRSCSSALAPTTMAELEELYGVPVLEAYGMTEASHQMASNPLPPGKRLPGSVGPGTGVDVAIMDEIGTLLPTDARGEIVIRGANVIVGYEDNPEANATSFTEGWFRTGDEGFLATDGYLTLTGRLKEMINRSGEKISPREIDEVLMDHPAVAEAVAFGVPHATHGEEPAAAVVLSGEAKAADLIAYAKTRLADFKVPRTIHIVDAIPKTATGKLQRRFVAEAFAGESAKS